MHRVSQLLLAVLAAGSLALGVRAVHAQDNPYQPGGADANPEAQLLERFQRDNRAAADKLNERLNEVLQGAARLHKTDPAKAVQLLRGMHQLIDDEPSLTRAERRGLIRTLQTRIDDAIQGSLWKLPRTTSNVLVEFRDPEAEERPVLDDFPKPPLTTVDGRLLFSNGAELSGVLHAVTSEKVRCTLDGQRLLIPGWQLPVVRCREGYYIFDYTLGKFLYTQQEHYAKREQQWHVRMGLVSGFSALGHGGRRGVPLWDALRGRFEDHGRVLTRLYYHGRPLDEVTACIDRHMPELSWTTQDPALEKEIDKLFLGLDRGGKRAVRGLIAVHADKSLNWQFTKERALAELAPRMRRHVPDLSVMQEAELADYILHKAELELKVRPL
jgi:hypothetical protein